MATRRDESDFPYIRKWGELMGSHNYYIEDQIAYARADKPPRDAIYWRYEDGKHSGPRRWVTTAAVTRNDTRRALGLPVIGLT